MEPQVDVDVQGPEALAAVDGDRSSRVDGGGAKHGDAGVFQGLLGLAGLEEVAGSWKLEGEGALGGEGG